MSRLVSIRKYMSLDQIVAYQTVYNTVINNGEPFASAVAILESADERRNGGAVKKIIDSLNDKFRDAFGQALIERQADDTWLATEVGLHVFRFARTVADELEDLESLLSEFNGTALSLTFAVRSSMFPIARQLLEGWNLAGFGIEIERVPMGDELLTSALDDAGKDAYFDELFFSDKSSVDRTLFRYFQLPERPIILALPPSYRQKIGAITSDEVGFKIANNEVQSLNVVGLKQAFSIRAAFELSGARAVSQSYTDSKNLEILSKLYRSISFPSDSISALAFSLNARIGYALLLTEEQLKLIEAELGVTHDRIRIFKDDALQYYNPAIIARKEKINNNPQGNFAEVHQAFSRAGEYRESTRGLSVSPVERDYSKPTFACSHCGYQIEYDESDETIVTRPCPSCLSVNTFELSTGIISQLKSSKSISYTDDIYDEHFVCPSRNCSAEFAPVILKTLKGRDFVFCDSCNTIYQSRSGVQESVFRACPEKSCRINHRFRVSEAKPIDEISCYNSMHRITYDSKMDIVTSSAEKFPVKVYEAEQISKYMAFPCPNFGCSDKRARHVTRNSEGQLFARCKSCGVDIHIKPKL